MLIKVKIFAKCPSVPQLTSITFHKLTHKAFNKGLRIIVFCNIKEPSHYTDVPKVVPATGDELSEPILSLVQSFFSHSTILTVAFLVLLAAKLWSPESPTID